MRIDGELCNGLIIFRGYCLGFDLLLLLVLGLDFPALQLVVHHLGSPALCQGHQVHPLHAQQVNINDELYVK